MTKPDDPISTDRSQIEALIARLDAGTLSVSDTRLISRLKRLLLGPGSDTRSPATATPADKKQDPAAGPTSPPTSTKAAADSALPSKGKGHGRLSSAAYTSASVVGCTMSVRWRCERIKDLSRRGRFFAGVWRRRSATTRTTPTTPARTTRGADVLLVPANYRRAIDPLHTRTAVFRAIESGVSLVRATL